MTGNKNALSSQLKQIGVLTTIPIILLAGPAVGYFTGGWLDRKFRIYPWFTVALISLGFIASGREVFRLLQEISKDEASKKDL
jgi:F0F1-type ATP synthase assembly protein I